MLATALALCGAASVQAVPVIPGAAGYGMDTKAGRGGAVYKVTNLNADGSGSLKACVDKTGPRTCVFEVSGAIRLTSELKIRNSQLRIAGQTAPSPGIMIRGAGIVIIASDMLIQHIRVRPGDDTNGPDPDNRDSLRISGTATAPVRNVVIDHCSFSWSIDEIASTWGPHDNISFTNNIFSEPLHESLHPEYDGTGTMPHGYGVLFGQADNSSITFAGNLLAHIVERNPLSRAAEFVMVNNLVYDRGTMDLDLQSEDRHVSKNSVVGNVFMRGPSYSRPPSRSSCTPPARIRCHPAVACMSTTTARRTRGSSYSALVTLTGGDMIPNLMTQTTAPVWNTGLVARKSTESTVYSWVLSQRGCASHRSRLRRQAHGVERAQARRTGSSTVCLPMAPRVATRMPAVGRSYAQNRRTLTLPTNQASIASNGYSNLENWLNSMDRSLEWRGAGLESCSSTGLVSAMTTRAG